MPKRHFLPFILVFFAAVLLFLPGKSTAFAAMPDRLYTASKTESRASFPHFQKPAGGEADEEA